MRADLRRLWIALAVLTGADAAIRWVNRPEAPVALASLPGFDRARAAGLRLGPVDAPTVLERGADGWRLVAPIDGVADPAEVDAVLAALADGVFPEAAVAEGGDLAPYGLAGGTEVPVEVTGDDGPLLTLTVGADAGGDGTFVRFPDDDHVYRARIGGRARYDRPPRTLLDRRVLGCTPSEVVRVAVASGEAAEPRPSSTEAFGGAAGATTRPSEAGLSFGVEAAEPRPSSREATRSGAGWVGLDPQATTELVAALCGLRGEVTDPARVEAWDVGRIVLDLPEPVELRLGRAGALRYVGRGDRVWRVPAGFVDRVTAPSAFADRTVWAVPAVEWIELAGPGLDGRLVRRAGGWQVERPANVDVDPARADAVATFLARPRVDRWEGQAPPGPAELTVRVSGGRSLALGPTTGDRVWVRTDDGRIGTVDVRVARALVALFGG